MGKPLPGVEVKIAEDGEVLRKGPNIFRGYYKNADATGDTSSTAGCTPATSAGSTRRLPHITGRKKDIIITAGGKNLSPSKLENDLKQSRWMSQAVMYGDRRPYPVMLITLDEEEIVPWARARAYEDTSRRWREPRGARARPVELDASTRSTRQVEQIKKFASSTTTSPRRRAS